MAEVDLPSLEKRVRMLEARVAEIQGAWKTLPHGITLGPEQFVDYQRLDHNFSVQLPVPRVLTGWGYGQMHNDVCMWTRDLRLDVPPLVA